MRADEKARSAATAGGRATGILGIVADDVTGATTVGALIAREDAEPTILFEHRTLRETSTGTEQVLITSTGSRAHHDRGVRAIVLDAVTLEHVDAIAQAAIALDRPYVCVDPGPLTVRSALRAGHLAPGARDERGIREDPAPDDEGTVLVVAGSASSVSHDQMGRLRVEPGTRVLSADVLALIGSEETFAAEVQRVLEDVRSACAGGMPRVALLALDTVISGGRTPRADLEAASGLTGARIGTRLTHRFARLARRVLEELGLERTTGLYLTGGDVMIDTVQALGARGLRMVDYVIPQVDQARLIGGPFDGLAVVCKGGLTGTDLTALHCVNRLFDERKSHDEH